MHPAFALVFAYLAGSIPSAYLAGRVLKGVDLRTVGSGNLGTTNVLRHLGRRAAVVVFVADALKGALPVALLPTYVGADWLQSPESHLWLALACGVLAILGHSKPIFLLWKGGGKGVATAAGVFAAIAPLAFGLSLSVFVLVVWRSRLVSLGSIVAALTLPGTVALTVGIGSPVFAVASMVTVFVVWSHRANMARIRAGTEPPVSWGKPEGTR